MYWKNVPIARLFIGGSLGCWIASHCEPAGNYALSNRMGFPGRVEGRVLHLGMKSDSITWCTVFGQVDLQPTSPVQCTVLVRLRSNIPSQALIGARILCYPVLRIPSRPVGADEFSEQQWADGYNAALVAVADSIYIMKNSPWIEHLRHSLLARCIRHLRMHSTDQTFAILTAVALGQGQYLDGDLKNAFVASGTVHILVVSGSHVGIVLGILLSLSGGVPRSLLVTSCIVGCVVLYVWLVGAQPPSVRACCMSALGLYGRLFERRIDMLNILGAVIILQLLLQPTLILRPSFVLSSIATAGIISTYQLFVDLFKQCTVHRSKVKTIVQKLLSAGLSANVGVVVPCAVLFKSLAVLSIPMNMVVTGAFTAILISGVLLVTVGWFIEPVAVAAASSANALISAVVPIVQFAQEVSPKVNGNVSVLLACISVAGSLWMLGAYRWRTICIRCVLVLALMWACSFSLSQSQVGVAVAVRENTVVVVAQAKDREVRYLLGKQYGTVFVRSLNEDPVRTSMGQSEVRNQPP